MPDILQLRKKIEAIDASIVAKLAAREKLAKRIGKLKSKNGLEIIDEAQETLLFERYEQLAEKHQINTNFVKKLFKIIIIYSRRVQKYIE